MYNIYHFVGSPKHPPKTLCWNDFLQFNMTPRTTRLVCGLHGRNHHGLETWSMVVRLRKGLGVKTITAPSSTSVYRAFSVYHVRSTSVSTSAMNGGGGWRYRGGGWRDEPLGGGWRCGWRLVEYSVWMYLYFRKCHQLVASYLTFCG